MSVMSKRPRGKKVRVSFKSNRSAPGRMGDLTRRYRADRDGVENGANAESVRAKGALSRKRTVLVDDNNAPLVDENLWRPGLVVTVRGQVARVEDAAGECWDCVTRRVLRTVLIDSRSNICVGDQVRFSDQSALSGGQRAGVIEHVEARKTTLSRRERRGREHALVANAEQLLIVASIAQPGLKPHLIDRYLVAAARGDLRPIICFNKWDLLAPTGEFVDEGEIGDDEKIDTPTDEDADGDNVELDEKVEIDSPDDQEVIDDSEFSNDEFEDDGPAYSMAISPEDAITEFERLGYRCIRASALTGMGLEELHDELRDRVTVLSGQSGVGKSSLLNALQPGLGLAVQTVSEDNEKGKHTTTHARLFRLEFGGHVVDTPGIRQFELWNVAPGELEACFTEFVPLVADCKFKDCHHTEEDGCGIIAAVEAGAVSQRRYFSYLKMLEELSRKGR